MKLGLIGLGKMGQVIGYRCAKQNHQVYGFDINEDSIIEAKKNGINVVSNLEELTKKTQIVWLMLPSGKTVDVVIEKLIKTLNKNSIIIDGGNSNFHDSINRYNRLKKQDIHFIDCGVSGGIHTKNIGCSLMIGGDKEIYDKVEPIFEAIAMPNGFAYLGNSGTGHYVKMIHNGIEYALLQAYSEGFHLLKEGYYKNLDLEKISNVWLHGSVIRSWILELCNEIFKNDQEFKNISGYIGGGQTGQWTIKEAKKYNINMLLIEKSLEIRKWSKINNGNFATKLVALLRNKFGGHEVKKIN